MQPAPCGSRLSPAASAGVGSEPCSPQPSRAVGWALAARPSWRGAGLAHSATWPSSPQPSRPSDAILLNNVVQNFGMLDLVKKVLASHKCQMDRSREQYARDLAGAWGPGPWSLQRGQLFLRPAEAEPVWRRDGQMLSTDRRGSDAQTTVWP